jgi:hypothetical protein
MVDVGIVLTADDTDGRRFRQNQFVLGVGMELAESLMAE